MNFLDPKDVTYEILVIDPPWPKQKGGRRNVRPKQGKELAYRTLPIAEIFTLLDKQIFSRASSTHTVFMWCVEEFLAGMEVEMHQRDYRRHTRLVWDKLNGIAPAFSIRFCHEFCVWFYKPKFTQVARDGRGRYSTVIQERARQHSRKPDKLYEMVNILFPTQRKLDVFSRERRDGWDQFGDQKNFFAREVGGK
jgi:N6-adenosine-specific RNA methylase IME4